MSENLSAMFKGKLEIYENIMRFFILLYGPFVIFIKINFIFLCLGSFNKLSLTLFGIIFNYQCIHIKIECVVH